MDKVINIRLLGWNDFTLDLAEDMWEIIEISHSLIVEAEKPIVLKFNKLTDRELTDKELTDWSTEMLRKYPEYILVPVCVKNNKIVCNIVKVKDIVKIVATPKVKITEIITDK